MKRTSAHLSRSAAPSAVLVTELPSRSSASIVAVEPLRFRERDGKPSAYTRLYAQGVDQLVRKDLVYQQYGLHKSPPAPSLQPMKSSGTTTATASSHSSSQITRATSSTMTVAHERSQHATLSRTTPAAGASVSSRQLMVRSSSSSSSRGAATSNINSARLVAPSSSTSPRHTKPSTSHPRPTKLMATASTVKKKQPLTTGGGGAASNATKPQRRQSTIATQLLNKTLKIGAAVIHSSSGGGAGGGGGGGGATSARSPRLSMTPAAASTLQQQQQQQQLHRRQSFQIPTTPPTPRSGTSSSAPGSRSVGKPPPSSSSPTKQPAVDPQQPPVLVPVSRRTSSPLVAPIGADFGGMRRRPSVSPIRNGNPPTTTTTSAADDHNESINGAPPSLLLRRDSKMDRLVEQITVLKNSLGLSEEDLQWKVESTKGNAYEAADRHLTDAEEQYDRLNYEIQSLSQSTPCDDASASLVKMLHELVATSHRVTELKPQLATAQAQVSTLKKQLKGARITRELQRATIEGDDDLHIDEPLALAQQMVDEATQKVLFLQPQVQNELTKLNELLIQLTKASDLLANACEKFQFTTGSHANEVSGQFVTILKCIPECCGDKMVLLCDQAIACASTFKKTKISDLQLKNEQLVETMKQIDLWKTRKENAKEFVYETIKLENQWKQAQLEMNLKSLKLLRSYIPVDIAHQTVETLIENASKKGVLFTYDLAMYIKQNKCLHWLITHETDIVRDNFLAVESAPFFVNFSQHFDINELRAICCVLPDSSSAKFEFDKDGKKADWKKQFMEHVKLLVKQQQGDTIKAGWDPVLGTRAQVPLKPLSEKQQLNAVYRYPTEHEITTRLQKFELQQKRLLTKKEQFVQLEKVEIPNLKLEYLAIADDARSDQLQQLVGKTTLIQMREQAKKALLTATKAKETLQSEISHSEKMWTSQSPNYAQFVEEVAKIRLLDMEIRNSRIKGPFPEEIDVKPKERATFKKLSVEEEAVARRQELSQAMAERDKERTTEESTVVVVVVESGAVVATVGEERAASDAAIATAEGAAAEAVVVAESCVASGELLGSESSSPKDPQATAPAAEAKTAAAEAMAPPLAEASSSSFRRVKSLRVSAEVLKFLQNDFCSPRRTKSNNALLLTAAAEDEKDGEVVAAVATGEVVVAGTTARRRLSFPKPPVSEPQPLPLPPPLPAAQAPIEPPRPKSKALAALLEQQERAKAAAAATSTTSTESRLPPRPPPAMRPPPMDFLSELKKKAAKGQQDSNSNSNSNRSDSGGDGCEGGSRQSQAVVMPRMGNGMDFLSELKKRAAMKTTTQPSTDSGGYEGEAQPMAKSTVIAPIPRPLASAPPPPPVVVAVSEAPRSFLDELKARAKRE